MTVGRTGVMAGVLVTLFASAALASATAPKSPKPSPFPTLDTLFQQVKSDIGDGSPIFNQFSGLLGGLGGSKTSLGGLLTSAAGDFRQLLPSVTVLGRDMSLLMTAYGSGPITNCTGGKCPAEIAREGAIHTAIAKVNAAVQTATSEESKLFDTLTKLAHDATLAGDAATQAKANQALNVITEMLKATNDIKQTIARNIGS